jgi:hypothetical protein
MVALKNLSDKEKDNAIKIMLRCRDCGRIRHFNLTGINPVVIQYTKKELGDEENE